jgi:predicted RNase H-like nuclease (RuvC/YqgF family)|tara:strand:+ start:1779 stop:2015 length:237 start_codon:yes stop_codon:yes gene_type:complete
MSSCEELVFALQREVQHLEARVTELSMINEQHRELNGSLRKELTSLKAQVNIKVMNGQWHMSNNLDADDLVVKDKIDE